MIRTLFRTRIKFCGMTRIGDVRLAGEMGADAVGFIFAENSPRRLEAEEARAMRQAMAPLVDAVALFRDNPGDVVREVVRLVKPNLLQFHGDEDDAFCRSFGVPWIKAIAMRDVEQMDARELHTRWPGACAFLFDSHAAGQDGGTGQIFDWSKLPTGLSKPCLLAGGLNPENVAAAIHATLPWGVDCCSGIESAPGIKDGERMHRFVEAVRYADCVELSDDPDNPLPCIGCN